MAIRLVECHRILKDTSSIYLHCDPTMSHYLKVLLDCIFGEENFRNEIVWCYRKMPNRIKGFQRNHDHILFYSRTDEYCFNVIEGEMTAGSKKTFEYGMRRGYNANYSKKMVTVFNWDKYKQAVKDGMIPGDLKPADFKGGNPPEKDWWEIKVLGGPGNKERTGYPTQKPLALLERIIKASSNTGDIVFDPFCGCATTCVAAEHLQRQWIGIDISIKAYELVNERLTKEAADPNDLLKYQNTIHLKTDAPKRTDLGRDYRETKFVYVISHPEYPGEYKVGIAKNWKSRLNAYQTSDPDRRYKVEFTHLTPYFRETEKHIHGLFPNKHEWVQSNLNEICHAIETHKPQVDLFGSY
ncbi:MAG: DNA methyltransferase [Paracoccaceae bacterium]|nr:DNA methyltransferase [Paracoccaceae bacterium]